MAKSNDTGIKARKMELGEKIVFDEFVISSVYSQYGEIRLVKFADADGKIFRAVFSDSLAKFMEKNPKAKSVTLKKKLQDGEMTYNVWEAGT